MRPNAAANVRPKATSTTSRQAAIERLVLRKLNSE